MAQLGRRQRQAWDDGWDDVPFDVEGKPPQGGDAAFDAGGLSSRFGLVGRRGVVVACGVVVALLCGVGVMRALVSGDLAGDQFQVERGDDDAAVAPAPEDADAAPASDASAAPVEAAPAEVVVHVDGAVAHPGVYRLSLASPRVGDAVDAAGGLAADADTTAVNLAEALADGMKVYISHQGEAQPGGAYAGVASQPGAAGGAEGGSGTGTGLVNINTATQEELETLPGVGEVTARSIIDDRERNGAFGSTDDLTRVDGIGEKRYAKVKDLVCV